MKIVENELPITAFLEPAAKDWGRLYVSRKCVGAAGSVRRLSEEDQRLERRFSEDSVSNLISNHSVIFSLPRSATFSAPYHTAKKPLLCVLRSLGS